MNVGIYERGLREVSNFEECFFSVQKTVLKLAHLNGIIPTSTQSDVGVGWMPFHSKYPIAVSCGSHTIPTKAS